MTENDPFGGDDQFVVRCEKMVAQHRHGAGTCMWPVGHAGECDPDIWADLLETEIADDAARREGEK